MVKQEPSSLPETMELEEESNMIFKDNSACSSYVAWYTVFHVPLSMGLVCGTRYNLSIKTKKLC